MKMGWMKQFDSGRAKGQQQKPEEEPALPPYRSSRGCPDKIGCGWTEFECRPGMLHLC